MKRLGLFILLFLSIVFADTDCPEQKQIMCTDDFKKAYPPCKKAAESGGADLPATL